MDINANIPSNLQEIWKKVSADGKIDYKDYDILIDKAAPNKTNAELSDEEISFLTEIKDRLESSKGEFILKEGTAESQMCLLDESEQPVPQSLQKVWNKVNADGKITPEEFEKLVKAAAPNKTNEEFSEDELEFLVKVKQNIEKQDAQSGKNQYIELVINNVIKAKNNPSELIKNVDNFEKAIQSMSNKELANVAQILAEMISKTDGNDKVLAELQQIALSKIN